MKRISTDFMKKFFAGFISMLFTTMLIAQGTNDKTLLWQISGKGIKAPSYLFGTLHLMCPDDLKVDETIKKSFSETKELFLEIKTDDPNMMMEMMAGIKMKDTLTLKGLLGKPSFDSISTIFKSSTGIPLEMLNTVKPIMVISMVYPSLLGCTPVSWEKTFEDLAKERKMPLKGLEKLQDQMNVLENIPYNLQAEMFSKMMYNLDSTKTTYQNMLQMYMAKDLKGLYDMTTQDDDFGKYEDAMLTNRNQNWIPIIISQSITTPTFFAVGAAHLPGDKGLINLLRKKGYKVKPVNY